MYDTMKTPKRITWLLMAFCLACWLSPTLKAQGQSESAVKETAGNLSERFEALEKQIESLRAELAALKKQQESSAAAASTTPTGPAKGHPGLPMVASLGGAGIVAAIQEPSTTTTTSPPTGQATSLAQAPGAGTAPATAPTLASLLGSTSVTGFVDGYYAYNFNHPQGYFAPSGLAARSPVTPLRFFDSPTNQFGLNMVELIFARPPDATNSRLGYNLTFGFGNAMNVVNGTDPGGLGFAQYLKEAYLSYLAPVGKGLQVDFGKFVTQHGAEVIETKDNWNYSRSLLFNYAIPFYHFGLRAKYTFNDKYQATAYLVNGWNNIIDNNTGKTLGLQFGWNPNKKVSVVQNYMVGPEETGNNSNLRQLWDTVVTYSPTGKLSLMVNYDYGRGDRVSLPTPLVGLSRPVWWSGVAGYVRYAFSSRYALATRYEYYDDHDGFTVTSGTPQHLNEFTGTFERTISNHLITRWEFRRDMSNQPTLLKGLRPVKDQNTVAAGLVYVFDWKESK